MQSWTIAEFVIFIIFSLLFVYRLIFKVSKNQPSFNEENLISSIQELHDDVMHNIKNFVCLKQHKVKNQNRLIHQDEISGQRPVLLSMKEDLLNCLDNDNAFGFYDQTIFKYDCNYIREMKQNNKVLFYFFFKRFVNSYHYLISIKNEGQIDESVFDVQTTLFFLFIQNTIFLTIIIRRTVFDFEDAILYSLIYNNAIVVPINLLVSKFMRNFTSVYIKMEFYFVTEKKQQDKEQTETKHKFWNFCSYLVFTVFALVAVNSVLFGQEIFSDNENSGQAIYSLLIVIGVDIFVGRFLFCFLFMIVKILSKHEKNKLLTDAKEFLFFQHLLLQKIESQQKSLQKQQQAEAGVMDIQISKPVLESEEAFKNDQYKGFSIKINDNHDQQEQLPKPEQLEQINEFEVEEEGPIHKGDTFDQRSNVNFIQGSKRHQRNTLCSSNLINNQVLTNSLVNHKNSLSIMTTSNHQPSNCLKHSSSNSHQYQQNQNIKQFDEEPPSSGQSSIESEKQIQNVQDNQIQKQFRLNELKIYENDSFFCSLKELREAIQNKNNTINNPNITKDLSILKQDQNDNYGQEYNKDVSNILNQTELNDFFPQNTFKRTETEFIYQQTLQNQITQNNMKTVTEEREDTNL